MADDPADRQDADARRLRLPPQHGPALRLSGQRPRLPENFLSMMFKMTELKYEPDPRLAQALDVLFILHADHEQNCSTNAVRAVGSSQRRPVLGGRRRRRRALRPAARRRQRGGAADAAPDRDDREHPRLPRGREEPRGEADGLRPPGLQELRPARADHQEARRRGLRGRPATTRCSRSPRELEKQRARRRVLHLAQALPERRLLLGPDLRGAGASRPTMFTGDLRDPAHRRLDRPVDGDDRRPGAEDRPAAPDLHRRRASATTSRSPRTLTARGPGATGRSLPDLTLGTGAGLHAHPAPRGQDGEAALRLHRPRARRRSSSESSGVRRDRAPRGRLDRPAAPTSPCSSCALRAELSGARHPRRGRRARRRLGRGVDRPLARDAARRSSGESPYDALRGRLAQRADPRDAQPARPELARRRGRDR